MINTCDYWENEAVYFEKYIWYNVKNLPSYQMQNIRFYFVYFSSMPFLSNLLYLGIKFLACFETNRAQLTVVIAAAVDMPMFSVTPNIVRLRIVVHKPRRNMARNQYCFVNVTILYPAETDSGAVRRWHPRTYYLRWQEVPVCHHRQEVLCILPVVSDITFLRYEKVILPYEKLRTIVYNSKHYKEWETILSAIVGIHLITDTKDGKHYVWLYQW